MKRHGGIILSLTTGIMEFCWIYAWAFFTTVAIVGLTPSFPSMAATFFFSVVLSRLSRGRGWRIVNLAGLHLLGYMCMTTLNVHGFYYSSYPVLETAWIVGLFKATRSPLEWFHLFFILIWVALFWYGGAAFSYRKKDYIATCTRFDIGLAAFFILLLTKLALRVKGGITTDDHVSSFLIYPYLLLAITAIGMARVGREGSRHFLPGYGGLGIFMSGLSLVLLCLSSLVLLLIPFLTQVAEVGQRGLKVTALWVLPVVTGIVRFMFMGGKVRSDPSSGNSPGGEEVKISTVSGWWAEIIDKILRRGLEILVIAFIVLIVALILYLIFRWLFSRTAVIPEATTRPRTFRSWLLWLEAFFFGLWRAIINVAKGYTKASQLYWVLSEWGRRSGLSRLKTDTPLEFGARLSDHFPALKKEIGSIVASFNAEAYGETNLTDPQFAEVLAAWRAVRNPVHWPRRFKTRFINKMLPTTKPFVPLQ